MAAKAVVVLFVLLSAFTIAFAEDDAECYEIYKNSWSDGIIEYIHNCTYITSYCNGTLHAVECVANITKNKNVSDLIGSMIYPGGFRPRRCALLHEPFKFKTTRRYSLLCSEKRLGYPSYSYKIPLFIFNVLVLFVLVCCFYPYYFDQFLEDWHDIIRFFKTRFNRNSIVPYEGNV